MGWQSPPDTCSWREDPCTHTDGPSSFSSAARCVKKWCRAAPRAWCAVWAACTVVRRMRTGTKPVFTERCRHSTAGMPPGMGATGCCLRRSSRTRGRIISAGYADEPRRRATLKRRLHEVKHADRSIHISYPDHAHEERRQGTVPPRTTGALSSLPAVTGWEPTADERSWLVCDTDEGHVLRQHWPLADTSPGSPDARQSRGGVERTDHRLTSSSPLTRCSSWSTDKTSLLHVVEVRTGGSGPTA
jgi:hypothetical protein